MNASRPIAWAIGLVVVAFGVAVIGGPQAFVAHFVAHFARLTVESPTIGSHLGTIVNEIELIAWDLFPFAMLSILLWTKLR
jgi:hypothetical protein